MKESLFEILEPAKEQNKFSKIYDYFMIVCISISIIPLFFKDSNLVFYYSDKAMAAVFIIDYILRWFTADKKLEKYGKIAFVIYPLPFLR